EQPPEHGPAMVHAQIRQRRREKMRSVETEGGSIDEAIQRALEMLRVGREQVEIEILDNATRGLFGIGSRRARVRATLLPPLDASLERVTADHAPVSRETSPRAGAGPRSEAAARAREVIEAILGHLVDDLRVDEVRRDDDGTIHLALSSTDSGIL